MVTFTNLVFAFLGGTQAWNFNVCRLSFYCLHTRPLHKCFTKICLCDFCHEFCSSFVVFLCISVHIPFAKLLAKLVETTNISRAFGTVELLPGILEIRSSSITVFYMHFNACFVYSTQIPIVVNYYDKIHVLLL